MDIAIQAALSALLVLATLHSDTAVNAVTRLQDMGVDRYLVGATLRLVIAQWIVRKLCSQCKKVSVLFAEQARALKRPQTEGTPFFEPGEGVYCARRWSAGRIGLYEMFPKDHDPEKAISRGTDEAGLLEMMRRRWWTTPSRRRPRG